MSHKKPVTLLIGFLGAKPRHLKKYASIISSIGINTSPLGDSERCIEHSEVISHQPPTLDYLSLKMLEERAEELRNKIMPILREENGTSLNRPLMTYLLSNNGSYSYAFFQAFLQEYYPSDYQW